MAKPLNKRELAKAIEADSDISPIYFVPDGMMQKLFISDIKNLRRQLYGKGCKSSSKNETSEERDQRWAEEDKLLNRLARAELAQRKRLENISSVLSRIALIISFGAIVLSILTHINLHLLF